MNASLRECKKVTFFIFSGKLENWSFWAASVQNLSQNGQKCPKSKVFCIFSKTAYWISLIFCMNASLRECKKVMFLFFSGKLENWTFWAESVKNWHFYGFLGVPRNVFQGVFYFLCVAHASDPA